MSKSFQNPKEELEVIEKRKIKRLTFSNYVSSVLNAFNLERGGIYTLRRLFINPGKMVRDYISVERYSFTPPFRLLLISTTLIILVLRYSKLGSEFAKGFTHEIEDQKILEIISNLSNFLNLYLWLFIPIISFFVWLFNRKRHFNFAENLVLQTYLYTIINVASLGIAFDHLINPTVLMGLISLISMGYYFYAYKEFFDKKWGRSIFEMSLILLLSTILYVVIAVISLVVVIELQK